MAEPQRPNQATPPPLAEALPDLESPTLSAPAPRAAAKPRPQQPLASANEEAQKHIREANLLRMRGQVASAAKELEAAIDLAPNDPEAHELLGDLLRQAGRTKDALASYTKATEVQNAPGRRATLEAKMARLALERDSVAIGQINRGSLMQGNVLAVVLLSAVVPGLGQILAGQVMRGAIILAAWAISLLVVVLLPETRVVVDGILQEIRGGPAAAMGDALKVLVVLVINLVIWIFAMADGAISARRAQEDRK